MLNGDPMKPSIPGTLAKATSTAKTMSAVADKAEAVTAARKDSKDAQDATEVSKPDDKDSHQKAMNAHIKAAVSTAAAGNHQAAKFHRAMIQQHQDQLAHLTTKDSEVKK